MPHTTLQTMSKHFEVLGSFVGKGRILLFPNLQEEQSSKAKSEGNLFQLIKQGLNKEDMVFTFGWPNLMCPNFQLF